MLAQMLPWTPRMQCDEHDGGIGMKADVFKQSLEMRK